MKRFVLAIVALCICSLMYSQKTLVVNRYSFKILHDGQEYQAMTSFVPFNYPKQYKFEVAFKQVRREEKDLFYIYFCYITENEREKIEEGKRLLLKTDNDDVVTLTAIKEYDSDCYDELGRRRELFSPLGGLFDRTVWIGDEIRYQCAALYEIPEEYFTKLKTQGTIKIRVETTVGVRDFTLPKQQTIKANNKMHETNRFSLMLQLAYEITNETINF